MARYDYDMIILGGGSAGLVVTSGAAQLGAKTLLIEKEPALGGDCLHYGCVPSKTLIRTAAVYHAIRNAPRYGLPPVTPPAVDFRTVAARIRSVIETIQKHDSPERFCGLGAEVVFGAPMFRDEHSLQVNGRTLTARTICVSTGSSPAAPPIEGLDRTPYLTNKQIFSLDRLPASLIVLGAGPIAIEMAQAFSRLGSKVTVIQRSGQILSKEDQDMADAVMEILRAEGVTIRLNTPVLRVKDIGKEREVVVLAGEREESLRAEEILVALGRSPNLPGLGLEQIGVEFTKKGLTLDRRLRTTQKHIYGAGDVTGDHIFTHAAGYEGGIVVSNAIVHLPRSVNYTFMPWCTYTEPELASIGLNEKRAREQGIEYSVVAEEFRGNDRALAEGESAGRIKMLLDRKGRPLGVQILGLHAGELVAEWVAFMNGKVKLSTLAGAVHPYPTLGEISKKAAGSYFAKKIFSDRVRKTLALLFRYQGRACEEKNA